MKTFFTFLSLLSISLIVAQKKEIAKTEKPAQEKINQTDVKGLKQGKWAKKHDRSVAYVYIGQFKDDKPVGTFTYYYTSSKVKAVIVHDENSDRSKATMYHDNSRLMASGIYKGELKDSVWSFYDYSGRVSSSETFVKGELNGMKYVYFVPNDINDKRVAVAKQMNFVNGKEDGAYIEYFEEGGIKGSGSYKNGYKNGRCIANHPNGKIMLEERYKVGKKHGFQRAYDQKGKEIGNRYFRDGLEIKGKALEKTLANFKAKGKSPNE
jgi:antitoxin component YwqK of YwqJK toxin-antitoxin module